MADSSVYLVLLPASKRTHVLFVGHTLRCCAQSSAAGATLQSFFQGDLFRGFENKVCIFRGSCSLPVILVILVILDCNYSVNLCL